MSAADTVSSLYPDRPIRPLPKRRLRERLSPEAADSIKYPPTPETTQPLFYYPYDLHEPGGASRATTGTPERSRIFRRNGGIAASTHESDEDEWCGAAPMHWRSSPVNPRLGRKVDLAQHSSANKMTSTASSADGYDSFENTNNKKKRKIPSPSDHLLNNTHTLADIGSLSISHPSGPEQAPEGSAPSGGHYTNSSFLPGGQGISGPGRGRYGRSRNGRSPLRALSDSSHNWPSRGSKSRPLHWLQPPGEEPGIISSAIAKAEKITPSQGQENISLLQQTGNTKANPASTQFTFTCESQVNSAVTWPGSDTTGSSLQSPSSKSSTAHMMQSTQTSPPRAGSSFDHKEPAGASNTAEPAAPRRKPRTKAQRKQKLEKELHRQADDRRRDTRRRNKSTNTHDDEAYMCLYCEYETLFGEPPWALIRQYELKDRQRRKEEAERKRLIEKAKNRSRKNRKGSGKGKGGNNSSQGQSQNQNAGPNGAPSGQHNHPDHADDVTDECYEDDDDEYDYVDGNEDGYHEGHHHHGPHHGAPGSVPGGEGSGGGRDARHHHHTHTHEYPACTCSHG